MLLNSVLTGISLMLIQNILQELLRDPKGPQEGTEHVIRGGSFKSTAGLVRSAARDYTRTDAWLKTDPQMPKSIWWYSDCFNVGFRVVCEFDEKTGNRGMLKND